VLGLKDLLAYTQKYGLTIPKEAQALINNQDYPKKPWSSFVTDKNQQFCSPEALDLLERML